MFDREPVIPASRGAEAKETAPFAARSAPRHWLVWTAAAVSVALAGCATVMVAKRPRALSEIELEGQQIFRYDTFGDEQKWTDQLRLHEIVDKMTPAQALALGLKVDRQNLNFGKFVLANPLASSGTRELLRQNAVVGVQATFRPDGHIQRLGVTCALCHSTVDNSMLPGIGNRLDGWPNRSLDVGKIIAMSPEVTPQQRAVYLSWGKGRYDPRFNIDGKNTPLVLPPAYGLAAVKNETYTAEAPISYWNAYVAVTQMGGHGNFSDPRLGINIRHSPDLVTPKLPALRAYQHSLPSPASPGRNSPAALRGQQVFAANCQSCHVDGNNTDNNSGVLHHPRKRAWTGAMRCGPPKKPTAPRRCAAFVSTLPISTTAAPPRSRTWSNTMTGCAACD